VTHTISPSTIITRVDRPSFSGSVSSPPNVPSGDTGVYNKGVSLAGGVNAKWDSSRQNKTNVLNPNSLNFNNFGDIKYYTTYVNYPSDDACGNDDEGAGDEDNDPYSAPHQGAVFGYDDPNYPAPHSEGSIDNTFEIRNHFRGFARLQLGTTWYRISDWYLWRSHFKFKKQNESEAAWNLDFNQDGDKLDNVPVWRNDGSSTATDNNGF